MIFLIKVERVIMILWLLYNFDYSVMNLIQPEYLKMRFK